MNNLYYLHVSCISWEANQQFSSIGGPGVGEWEGSWQRKYGKHSNILRLHSAGSKTSDLEVYVVKQFSKILDGNVPIS